MKFHRYVFIFICLSLVIFIVAPSNSFALTEAEIQAQEAKWKAELEATKKEIAEWENILNQTKTGTASLERDAVPVFVWFNIFSHSAISFLVASNSAFHLAS